MGGTKPLPQPPADTAADWFANPLLVLPSTGRLRFLISCMIKTPPGWRRSAVTAEGWGCSHTEAEVRYFDVESRDIPDVHSDRGYRKGKEPQASSPCGQHHFSVLLNGTLPHSPDHHFADKERFPPLEEASLLPAALPPLPPSLPSIHELAAVVVVQSLVLLLLLLFGVLSWGVDGAPGKNLPSYPVLYSDQMIAASHQYLGHHAYHHDHLLLQELQTRELCRADRPAQLPTDDRRLLVKDLRFLCSLPSEPEDTVLVL